MDTKEALEIAIEHYDWGEDIPAEIYSLVQSDLQAALQIANVEKLEDLVNEIDPGAIERYGFKADWELRANKLILAAYSISLPSYENTSAFLRLKTTGIQGVVKIFIDIYNDRGQIDKCIELGELVAGKIKSTIARWAMEIQVTAYYRQNNQICLATIASMLASHGYPVEWIENFDLRIYEWTAPEIGSLYSPKIGTPIVHPFAAIEVVTFDLQTYYLPTSAICRHHNARSISELQSISPTLVHSFVQTIDGFIELNPRSLYPVIDRAIFRVGGRFSFKYKFDCPIPEIAAIACKSYY